MAQFFGIEDIKDLTKASQTTIDWAAGSNLRIGGQAYNVTSVLTLDTATDIDTGSIVSDTIYYVYAVVVAGTVSLKYSLSDSAPTGYSAYRLIGSFGTDDVSEISGTSNKDQGKVGDVIHSMLTEEQFIAENGAGWVLADGRDVTGSKYATVTGNTTVPDMRGQFLRGKDHGRHLIDGRGNPDDLNLGVSTEDKFEDHKHDTVDNSFGKEAALYATAQGQNPPGPNNSNMLTGTGSSGGVYIRTSLANSGGGNETRPKNTTVNIFIKIEDIAI